MLANLTSFDLTVAVKVESGELILSVDGVVGAGLAGDGLQKPVKTLEMTLYEFKILCMIDNSYLVVSAVLGL